MTTFTLILFALSAGGANALWLAIKNNSKPQKISGIDLANFILYGRNPREEISYQNGKLIRSLTFDGIFGDHDLDQGSVFRTLIVTFTHVEGQSYGGPIGFVTAAQSVIEPEKDGHGLPNTVIAKVFCSDAMFACIQEMNALIQSAPENQGKQFRMLLTRSKKILKANLLLKIWRFIRIGPEKLEEWQRTPSPIDDFDRVGAHLLLGVDHIELEDFSYLAYPWSHIKDKTDFLAGSAKSPERLYLMKILSKQGPRYPS